MTKYRVDLHAHTEKSVIVEAESEAEAAERASEEAYDSVDEVDRGSWRVESVSTTGATS